MRNETFIKQTNHEVSKETAPQLSDCILAGIHKIRGTIGPTRQVKVSALLSWILYYRELNTYC